MTLRIPAMGLLALVLVTSCQKKDETIVDPTKVVFDIASPTTGQTYHSGDTVYIKATVTYPAELHGYEVKITDTTTGTIVYDETQHIHDDHFVIDDKWTSTVSQPLGLKLSITASIDHDGDDARKELNFTMVP